MPAVAPSRRRQRRRFRYRKQAWCLLVSLLILGLGANLLIMVRILIFTAEPKGPDMTVTTKLSSASTSNTISNGNTSNASTNYRSLTAKFFGLLLAIAILVRGLHLRLVVSILFRELHPLHAWQAIVLAPIAIGANVMAFVLDSIRAAFRWCRCSNSQTARSAAAPNSNPLPRPAMTVTETLEAFNRERSARGESTVSTESIEAYERFLRDLATFIVIAENSATANTTIATANRGIPKAQLEDICPRWTINDENNKKEEAKTFRCRHHFLSQTECGICLEAYSEKVPPSAEGTPRRLELRTLPCKHTFHARCIDQWLERSVSCPTCKGSVLSPPQNSDHQMASSDSSSYSSRNEINENIFIL